MKQDVERMNRILKRFAVIGGAAAILLSMGVGGWLMLSRHENSQNNSETLAETVKIDTQAVLQDTSGARNFVNRELPAYPDDQRAVFKIIEVIPHESCSIFPYLIDWKTEEEYNKNVPIGYEGLFWCASHTGSVQMFSKSTETAQKSNPFTLKEGYARRDYLSVYNGLVGVKDSGKWFQETASSSDSSRWLTQNGYFEYVGSGNGLYYIPVSFVAETQSESGIHYEIQAISRKGSQTPKGEMYVKSPAYYWAKDSASDAKPEFESSSIQCMTAYNYDLTFSQSAAGAYRADTSKLKEKTVNLQGVSTGVASVDTYDYFLTVIPEVVGSPTVSTSDWTPGFVYYKKGNYEIASVAKADNGDFVRVDDNRNSDGYRDASLGITNSGYFIAYSDTYSGAQRYNVTFEEAATADGGYYVANAPDWLDTMLLPKYYFKYTGDNKGRYDLPFIYNAATVYAGATYSAEILEVEQNQGRYALTSTEKQTDGSPIYVEKDDSGLPCDYSKVITNINFSPYDYDDLDWEKKDNPYKKWITLGGNSWTEWGGWVFHEITDASEMDVTKLNSVHKNLVGTNSNTNTYFNIGDRIYVTNQRRVYRYYTRDDYVNNEWFKLLCYSDNPRDSEKSYGEMVDGVGYDMSKTAEENLQMTAAKELISAFDNQFRIEIVQMTPDKLTPADVEDADLLYFSSTQGVEGIAQNWDQISAYLVSQGFEALPELGSNYKWGGEFTYTSDISDATLFAIYRSCIYERTTALMMNRVIRTSYTYEPASDNLMKLYYFMDYFKDAMEWAYFIDGYPEYRDTYSTIRQTDGAVRAYIAEGDEYYNVSQPEEGTPEYDNFERAWDPLYFEVRDPITHQYLLSGDTSFTSDGHTSTNQVYEDETKYLFQEYIVNLFKSPTEMHNIWKILNSRSGVGDIVVEITNAEMLADTARTKVIYANEFDPSSFDVDYKVFRLGGKGAPTPLTNVTVTFEDTSEVVWTQISPLYDTDYTTNVRRGFTVSGSADATAQLNPAITERKVRVVATDSAGKTGSATVTVILREAFNLN